MITLVIIMLKQITISDIQSKIGALSIHLRKQHQLTQADLAENLCISRSAVQKIEKGENITMSTFLLLLQHFNYKQELVDFLNEIVTNDATPNLYNDE